MSVRRPSQEAQFCLEQGHVPGVLFGQLRADFACGAVRQLPGEQAEAVTSLTLHGQGRLVQVAHRGMVAKANAAEKPLRQAVLFIQGEFQHAGSKMRVVLLFEVAQHAHFGLAQALQHGPLIPMPRLVARQLVEQESIQFGLQSFGDGPEALRFGRVPVGEHLQFTVAQPAPAVWNRKTGRQLEAAATTPTCSGLPRNRSRPPATAGGISDKRHAA